MNKTIIINSEYMGQGDSELGHKLMGSFLRKLSVEKNKPHSIVFYNSGVKLLAEGSPVLDGIDLLSKAGVTLVACGTCIIHYKLKDKIKSGVTSNMQHIIDLMMKSDNVVTI